MRIHRLQSVVLVLLQFVAGLSSLLAQSTTEEGSIPLNSGEPRVSSPLRELPADIYPDSGNRLPLLKREQLDAVGKRVFDESRGVNAASPGPQASTAIKLYSPQLEEYQRKASEYIRTENGLGTRWTELAILVTAREFDQQYEWSLHQGFALRAGIEQHTIDIIKYRQPITNLSDEEALIIQLGRELFGDHKVRSETFAKALRLFGAQHLVNLTALMGHYAATAALLITFDQQLPESQPPLLPNP